jgi:dTDP-4-amino-4,6-dideoxy-D-galactose acyltransferase
MPRLLQWDTDFFGWDVGTLRINSNDDLSKFAIHKFDLVYIYSSSLLEVPEQLIHPARIELVDEKVTYQKEVSSEIPNNEAIYSYPKDGEITDVLISLAIESGQQSRFKKDSNIPKEKFTDLYRLWITNSVKRKLADEVLVYKTNDKIIGLITISKNEDESAQIGIIAVDKDARGTGVGHRLMIAAEYWSATVGSRKILKVATQASNKGANSFYLKSGYEIASREYVYHLWNLSSKIYV